MAGEPTEYNMSGITVYSGSAGLKYNDIIYGGNGDVISLNLSGSDYGYTSSTGKISGSSSIIHHPSSLSHQPSSLSLHPSSIIHHPSYIVSPGPEASIGNSNQFVAQFCTLDLHNSLYLLEFSINNIYITLTIS